MANAQPEVSPAVKTALQDLDGVKTQADVARSFSDIHNALSSPKAADRSAALESLKKQDLKAFGLEGFHIENYDPSKFGKAGGLVVADKEGHKHILDPKGNEFQLTSNNKVGAKEKGSPLPDAQMPIGEHGRKMGVTSDGTSGKYDIKSKDSLWNVAADLLHKDNKHLKLKDIKEIKEEIDKLAKANDIKDPNKIHEGKSLSVPVPQAEQEKAKAIADKAIADKAAADKAAADKAAADKAAADKAAADKAAADKAAADKAAADKRQAEEQAAREVLAKKMKEAEDAEKLKQEKLADTSFHPENNDPKLKPQQGIYNPLAPKGLAEGTPTRNIDSEGEGIRQRQVDEVRDDKGNLVGRKYTGSLADRGWYFGTDSTFTADEKLDAKGGLAERTVTYPGNSDGSADYWGANGTQIHIDHPDSIHTVRTDDGNYTNHITLKSGPQYDIVTGPDGKVISSNDVQSDQ